MRKLARLIALVFLAGTMLFHPLLPWTNEVRPNLSAYIDTTWLPSFDLYLIHGSNSANSNNPQADCSKFVVTNSKGEQRLVSRIESGQLFDAVKLAVVEKETKVGIYFRSNQRRATGADLLDALGLLSKR